MGLAQVCVTLQVELHELPPSLSLVPTDFAALKQGLDAHNPSPTPMERGIRIIDYSANDIPAANYQQFKPGQQ